MAGKLLAAKMNMSRYLREAYCQAHINSSDHVLRCLISIEWSPTRRYALEISTIKHRALCCSEPVTVANGSRAVSASGSNVT